MQTQSVSYQTCSVQVWIRNLEATTVLYVYKCQLKFECIVTTRVNAITYLHTVHGHYECEANQSATSTKVSQNLEDVSSSVSLALRTRVNLIFKDVVSTTVSQAVSTSVSLLSLLGVLYCTRPISVLRVYVCTVLHQLVSCIRVLYNKHQVVSEVYCTVLYIQDPTTSVLYQVW